MVFARKIDESHALLRARNAEADSIIVVVERGSGSGRRTRRIGGMMPSSSAYYPDIGAIDCPCPAVARRIPVPVVVAILNPLRHVCGHVKQQEGVRYGSADRRCRLTALPPAAAIVAI